MGPALRPALGIPEPVLPVSLAATLFRVFIAVLPPVCAVVDAMGVC